MIYNDILSRMGQNEQGKLLFIYPYSFPMGNLNNFLAIYLENQRRYNSTATGFID